MKGLRHTLAYVGAVPVVGAVAARWPDVSSLAFWMGTVAYCSYLYWSSRKVNRTLPRFSLRALCLLLGLVGCHLALSKQRPTWQQVHAFAGHNVNIAMSPDGSMVATNRDTSIEIRDTKSGKHLKTLDLPTDEVTAKGGTRWYHEFAFSDDNSLLLTAGWRNEVHLYDWQKGVSVRSWNAGSLPRISRSGLRFVGTPSNGETRVYDVNQDDPLLVVEVKEPRGPSHSQLSENGKYVVAATGRDTLEVWDVDAEAKCFTITGVPMRSLIMMQSSFSPDEERLAIATSSGIAIWDVSHGKKIGDWEPANFDHVGSLEWSPDGTRLFATYLEMIGPSTPAAAGTPNAVHHCFLLDNTGHEIAEVVGNSATFSPSGDRIATVHGVCNILDGKTGRRLTNVAGARPTESIMGSRSLLFSPDGNWLFTNGSAAVFERIRSESWFTVLTLPAYWGTITCIVLLVREAIVTSLSASAQESPKT